MVHAQREPILAATDTEDPESSMPSAGGQRKRMLPICSAVCVVCCLLASLALAGFRTRPHVKFGGRVGLAALSDDDAIWSSVSGAATIEQLQEQLDGAKGKAKAALEEKMVKLKQDIPDWEEIISTYSNTDAWDEIKSQTKLEELQQAVEDAKASGSDKLEQMQEQLRQAQAAVPSVDGIKDQASAFWQNNMDQLPELGDVQGNAHKIGEDMHDSVTGMVDSAKRSFRMWDMR